MKTFKEFLKLIEQYDQKILDALDALNSHSSYDDEQVLPREEPKMDDLWYEDSTKGLQIYLDRDGIKNAGPHNFHFFNMKDAYVGSCNLGKNNDLVTINTIGIVEDARGWGLGMEFYLWLLDEKKFTVISDKEMSDGAVALYKKLLKDHKGYVVSDGRVSIFPK